MGEGKLDGDPSFARAQEQLRREIAQTASPRRLMALCVDSLSRLMRSDLAMWNDQWMPSLRPVRARFSPPVGNLALSVLTGFVKHAHEHPVLVHSQKTGEIPEVFRLSDFANVGAFRRTALFREAYRHLYGRHQLGIILPAPFPLVRTIVFNRWRTDFGAREMGMAEAIRPLLVAAVERVFATMDAELVYVEFMEDPETGMGVRLTPDFNVLEWPEPAFRVLQQYCGVRTGDRRLPPVLENWVRDEMVNAVVESTAEKYERRLVAQNVLRQGPRQLVVTLVMQSDHPVLLLTECDGLSEGHHEAWNRLTRRKKEIMQWVVEGKTNSEIGVILNISGKAVEKHVAELCRFFGVNNRIGLAREYFAK